LLIEIELPQAGTVTSVGSASRALTNPGTANTVVVALNHLGTLTTQGTITISTGGTITMPSFTTANAAGDGLRLTNQAVADTTGGNYSFTFPWTSP
jgi:hypothetical protein